MSGSVAGKEGLASVGAKLSLVVSDFAVVAEAIAAAAFDSVSLSALLQIQPSRG